MRGKFHLASFYRCHLTLVRQFYRLPLIINGSLQRYRSFLCSTARNTNLCCSKILMASQLPEYRCSFSNQKPKSFVESDYEEAVQALNNLQSNEVVLQKIRKEKLSIKSENIPSMQKYLNRIKLTQQDLAKLHVIHVSGTKGKGSTCAFVERLLMERGYKTGFYSSPHLVVVRERIRISGIPISRAGFTHYFWEVYNMLQSLKKDPGDMPAYFKFLTLLAFKVFLSEKVDVAILEVGIGGEHDCTNVVEYPYVCGITALDIDHTSVLGSSIESIAWHKAGIMKSGVPAFTVEQEYPTTMPILTKRAQEKNCSLKIVPSLSKYSSCGTEPEISLSGEAQSMNASLALQLAHFWLQKKNGCKDWKLSTSDKCNAFPLDDKDHHALMSVVWPGRSQILRDGLFTYFLDGAHTYSSMRECIKWYKSVSPNYSSDKPKDTFRILLFNVTADRDPEVFMRSLLPLGFDFAIFTTNLAMRNIDATSDQKNFTVSMESQYKKCQKMKAIWDGLCQSGNHNGIPYLNGHHSDETAKNDLGPSSEHSRVFSCITDAVSWFKIPMVDTHPKALLQATRVNVLVTGSLHLIGGFISVVDPTLSSLSQNSQHVRLPENLNSKDKVLAL